MLTSGQFGNTGISYITDLSNYVKCDQLALTWVPLYTTVEAVYSQPYKAETGDSLYRML